MNKVKTTDIVLNLLADGQFHSGQEIGEDLGITRSAIWKAIHELSNRYGLEIESVVGKGYRIENGLALLCKNSIQQALSPQAQQAIDEITLLRQIDSTNNYLMNSPSRLENKVIACFAEQQTKGKGRRGRHWASPFGYNIYNSISWSFAKDPGEIVGLSLAVAIAVIRTLNAFGVDEHLGLKWPNDIYYRNKKLAGILIEFTGQSHDLCQVIIGTGINTHLPDANSAAIDQPYATVDQILNKKSDRNKLAALLLNQLVDTLQQFSQQGLTPFLETWNQYDLLANQEIILSTPQKQLFGTMKGVSNRGELIMVDAENNLQSFLSGDVSVRKGSTV